MQNLVRSKTIGVTGNGGRGTAGAGPGRDLLYIPTHTPQSEYHRVTEVSKTANKAKMAEKCIAAAGLPLCCRNIIEEPVAPSIKVHRCYTI